MGLPAVPQDLRVAPAFPHTNTAPSVPSIFPNKSSSSPLVISLTFPWTAFSLPLCMQQAGDHWESPRASCERGLSSDEVFELTLELGLSKFWGMSESPGGCIKNAVSRASGNFWCRVCPAVQESAHLRTPRGLLKEQRCWPGLRSSYTAGDHFPFHPSHSFIYSAGQPTSRSLLSTTSARHVLRVKR